jgi:hypothetical protein
MGKLARYILYVVSNLGTCPAYSNHDIYRICAYLGAASRRARAWRGRVGVSRAASAAGSQMRIRAARGAAADRGGVR